MSYAYDPNSRTRLWGQPIRIVHDSLGDCGCAWPTDKAGNITGPRTCYCLARAIQRQPIPNHAQPTHNK